MIIGDAVEQLCRRSVSDHKWPTISRDIHLREALDQVTRIDADLRDIDQYAVLTLKAEAILARKGTAVLNWLQHNDFEVVHVLTTRITAERSRIIWRWQLEKATRHRLWVMDNILNATESVVLIVRRSTRDGTPAPTWLSRHKGPADPLKQRRGQLRHLLEPSCYLLNFVHTCDDVTDMFRDVAILSGMDGLVTLCEMVSGGGASAVDAGQTLRRVEANSLFHDLSLAASSERLVRFAGERDDGDPLEHIEAAIVDAFCGIGRRRHSPTAHQTIDAAVFVAHRFEMSLPGQRDPFSSVSGTQ